MDGPGRAQRLSTSTRLFGPFPVARPTGLRRRSLPTGTELWRIDTQPPEVWDWAGFSATRNRFDSGAATFRSRYAAMSLHGAARERYLATGRYLPADHQDHHVVRLIATRPFRALDLRTEANLDALDVDDRISTGRELDIWDACHRLADAVRHWWNDLDGIVYRSRTTPATSANVAFFSLDGLAATSQLLRTCSAALDDLVLHHQFTIGFEY